MSIKLKINLLLTLSLLIFTIVISVPVTFFVTESKRSEFENSLIHAENVFYEFLENQKKNLTKQSQLIGELPILSVVVENGDPETCRDSGMDYIQKLGCDVLDLYDFDGVLLASVGFQPGEKEAALIGEKVLAVLELGSVQSVISYRDDLPVVLTFVPIGHREDPLGVLVTGFKLDHVFLKSISEHTGSDILVDVSNRLSSASLPRTEALDLIGAYQKKIKEGADSNLIHFDEHMGSHFDLAMVSKNHKARVYLVVSEKELNESLWKLRWMFFSVALGLFAVVLTCGILYSRQITGPIVQASQFADSLSKGHLDHSLTINRSDELGTMLNALEEMRQNLKDMIENLDSKIEHKTQQLELETAAANIAKEDAQKEKDNAEHALHVSQETEQRSKEIMSEVEKMIGEIKGFAKQTDLLALNASIEAVSAGEAGKSFSVVANEVQFLSKRINDLTDHMGKKVQEFKA